MKLEVVRDPKKFDYYTPEDEQSFEELIKEESALSLFLYSRNVLTSNGIVPLDKNDMGVRTVAKSGIMYAPVCFFRDFLGKEIETDEKYLPLIATCESLGIFAKTYNDGLLAVVGGKGLDEAIAANPRLIYAGGYATLGKYDASKFTSKDYKAAKKKWVESIVGSKEINDMSIPEIREKIELAERNYETALSKFHRDPNTKILFGEKLPTDSVDLKTQYDYLETFAVVWAMHGSKYFGEGKILEDILFGLEWMYENMYGEAEIEERGWRSARAYDWWHWFVGGPEPLMDIMFIVEDHLTMETKRKYLKCFWWVVSFMRQGYYQNCATSRIRVCTKGALLLEDAQWLENEFYDYDLLNEVNEEGEGPHIDYVNWTHVYPYNFIYGNNNLCRVLFVGAILGGTPLEFTSPKQYNLFKLAKYMFEPVMYKGRASQIFVGRCIGNEYSAGISTVAQLLPMIGLYGEDEDAYIKRIIKRNSVAPEVVQGVKAQCQLPELKKYIEILADESISYENSYEIAHAYFTGDRAVQQRNDYAVTVALCSDRHPSYESINGANKIAWYTGDGAFYLMTNNDAHTFDAVNFFLNEKVMMNVAGTTVDTQKRIPWSHRVGLKGGSDFAGSLSVDGKYAACAMDYRAYNHKSDNEPTTDCDYGGGYLNHSNDLVAKKAYFLLDRECVFLGAGITSTTQHPVKTVVEDRPLVMCDGEFMGTDRCCVDSTVLPMSDFDEMIIDSPDYASVEGVGGYVFLEDMTVSAEKFTVTEFHSYKDGSIVSTKQHTTPKRFIKYCIEHGENPENSTYAYATLPYATEEELTAYRDTSGLEIISNTPDCQAVRKKSIGFESYVFYKAGECGGLRVSDACIASVYDKGDTCVISACDPTMKLTELTLTVKGTFECLSADSTVKVSHKDNETVICINTDHSVGRPYTAEFKK